MGSLLDVRYFIDTEFDDDRDWPALISIGLVAEDGREYYAELASFDRSGANPWVAEHVVTRLGPVAEAKAPGVVRDEIGAFFLRGATEVWGYVPAYDWVLLHRLFGRWDLVPGNIPFGCFDLRQWRHQLGNPPIPELDPTWAHHALVDARWAASVYQVLDSVARSPLHVVDRSR